MVRYFNKKWENAKTTFFVLSIYLSDDILWSFCYVSISNFETI